MIPPIPILGDYGISPEYGFLPTELPLERLPDPYYNKWEAIVANLQGLILTRRLRGVVDRLPILSTAGLEHDSEWRRAYSLLCFMAHGYIWGGDSPSEVLAIPFYLVVSYANSSRSVCRPQFPSHCSISPTTSKFLQWRHTLQSACGILSLCLQMSMSIT